MIYNNITEMVGNTPLVRLNKLTKDLDVEILVKVEAKNPAYSVKDRIALAIIRAAEASGNLKPGGTIIEATSGNTGIGLAAMGAALGYKVIIVMPSSMSVERRMLMRAYGAELILTGEGGMKTAVETAEKLASETENAILARQFENAANPAIHEATTAQEILRDTDGNLDIFVAGFGTGGTISGVGHVLKQQDSFIQIVGVEPKESPLLVEGFAAPHGIQGLGANFVPDNLDRDVMDEIMTIESALAQETSRQLAAQEGLLVGISAGANVAAALELAKRPENKGKRIVTVLPDTGERYLSTPLFDRYQD